MSDNDLDISAAFRRGLELMRTALGPGYAAGVERSRDRAAGEGEAERVELPIALTWGWLMHRPGLSRRERSIAMIAVDVARGHRQALAEHLKLGTSAGLTEADLRELFLHLGPYAGYPALNDAWTVLADHIAAARSAAQPEPATPVTAGSPQSSWLGSPPELHRISIVVPDAARAAVQLAVLLGISDWNVARVNGDRAEFLVAGRPVPYELVRALGVTAEGTCIELIEPRHGAITPHLALLSAGPGVSSVLVAELDADEASRMTQPQHRGHTVWRTAAGPEIRSLGTTDSLGFRIELASPTAAAFDAALGVDETWHLGPGSGGGLVPVGPFGHLGVVVPDIEAATRAHARAFGRRRWPVLRFSTDDSTLTRARYGDEPGTETYLSSIARVGGFAVELIQPTRGPSRYREGFLQPRGVGVQHLFFGPLATPGEWDGLVTSLRDHGYALVTDAYGWDEALEYAYVDTLGEIGFDIEIVRMLRPTELRVSDHAVLTFEHPAGS